MPNFFSSSSNCSYKVFTSAVISTSPFYHNHRSMTNRREYSLFMLTKTIFSRYIIKEITNAGIYNEKVFWPSLDNDNSGCYR